MQDIMERIKTIFQREPWWAEFWSGLTAIVWGVVALTSPGRNAWLVSFTLPPFTDNAVRVLFAMAIGTAQTAACLTNIRVARWCMAAIGSWFWMFLVLNVFAASITPGVAVYMGWVFVNLFSVVRLLRKF